MRYVLALIIAGVVTFMLFLGMQALITGGEGAMTEPAKGNVLDFVRLKKEERCKKRSANHKSHQHLKSHHRQWNRHKCKVAITTLLATTLILLQMSMLM
jgi:hypothetical protein